MTKTISLTFASVLAVLAVSFVMVGSASAANISNVEYSNGDVTIQGKPGENVSGKVRIVVGNNEEVEFVQFDVVSDNLAPHCVDTGRLQEGTHFVNIDGVKFPPNTGTYSLNVTTHGIYGGLAADDCVGDQNDSTSFSNSVRTVGSSSSSSVVGSSYQALIDAIANLKAQIDAIKNPTTPVASTKCAALATKSAGTQMNVYSQPNTVLQGYLLSEGASIPALTAGASFGYYGPQTAAAVSWFKSVNSCI